MKYIPITIDLLALNQPIPVDVWAPDGRLLLKRGQSIDSPEDKDLLRVHQASTHEADARAWKRSHERVIRQLLREGATVEVLAASRRHAVGQAIRLRATCEKSGPMLRAPATSVPGFRRA